MSGRADQESRLDFPTEASVTDPTPVVFGRASVGPAGCRSDRPEETNMPKSKPETKAAMVRRMLARKSGADLSALQKATGWQPHSVRAALSTLRKAGYQIDRLPPKTAGGSAVYKITGEPSAT